MYDQLYIIRPWRFLNKSVIMIFVSACHFYSEKFIGNSTSQSLVKGVK
jgi:hypothetical protein